MSTFEILTAAADNPAAHQAVTAGLQVGLIGGMLLAVVIVPCSRYGARALRQVLALWWELYGGGRKTDSVLVSRGDEPRTEIPVPHAVRRLAEWVKTLPGRADVTAADYDRTGCVGVLFTTRSMDPLAAALAAVQGYTTWLDRRGADSATDRGNVWVDGGELVSGGVVLTVGVEFASPDDADAFLDWTQAPARALLNPAI